MSLHWVFDELKDIINSTVLTRSTYIITDDKEEFLERIEAIAKRGLKNDADNLKCLEILASVKDTREGKDIFEAFRILRDWKNRRDS